MRASFYCSLLSLILAPVCQAALTLVIDEGSQLLWLEGDDTGTPYHDSFYLVYWASAEVPPSPTLEATLSIADTVSLDSTPHEAILYFYSDDSDPQSRVLYLGVADADSYSDIDSVETAGTSYAGLDEVSLQYLESLVGDSLELDAGTGYSNVAVVSALVPEPSVYAVLAGAGVLGYLCVRRSRRPKL